VPPRDWRNRLLDIVEASERIDRYTAGMDFATFTANELVADGVTRNLSIIGEAVRHVPEDVQARFPNVPWRLIRDMRNVLIHDYPAIDLEIVWQTIQIDLPRTITSMREILEQESGSHAPGLTE
jgi:uncharacterized protein with HEPN domain